MSLVNSTAFKSDKNPFESFWLAGYECSDQLNAFGNRVDLLTETGHLQQLQQDYSLLKDFNIRTVREGIRWSQVEKRAYEYDWTTVDHMMMIAGQQGIQQVWDLCHFGYPDDLSPLHPMFARRFAQMCKAFVVHVKNKHPERTLIVTPINEVSFISWLGGDARGTTPYCWNQGWEVKYALMRAYIEAVYEMRSVDPTVRILSTEPLVNIVPKDIGDRSQIHAANKINEDQFQAMDILTGRICPELGGAPSLLDIHGLNYYYNNQWINCTSTFLPWFNEDNDPRWRPLSDLLINAFNRYNKPVILSETSHCGEHRPNWIEFIRNESIKVLDTGIPYWGVCLYPIINRPDWDHMDQWHDAGLWNVQHQKDAAMERDLYLPYAIELMNSQEIISRKFEELNPTIIKEGFIHHQDRLAV